MHATWLYRVIIGRLAQRCGVVLRWGLELDGKRPRCAFVSVHPTFSVHGCKSKHNCEEVVHPLILRLSVFSMFACSKLCATAASRCDNCRFLYDNSLVGGVPSELGLLGSLKEL